MATCRVIYGVVGHKNALRTLEAGLTALPSIHFYLKRKKQIRTKSNKIILDQLNKKYGVELTCCIEQKISEAEHNQSSRSTQPGHPSVGRRNDY